MSVSFIGKKAPAFKAKDQNGEWVSLKDFKGKNVVLYFYPQDGTPTCTVQACNLRDHFGLLRNKNFIVIGVSPDDERKHKKFEDKHELPFILIADTDLTVIKKYDVWGEKMMYGKKYMGLIRTTFLIDENGIVKHVIEKPKAKEHAQEILTFWDKLK